MILQGESLSAVPILPQTHSVRVSVDLLDEDPGIDVVDPTLSRGELLLPQDRVGGDLALVGVHVLVVVQRVDEQTHEVVDRDLIHLLDTGEVLGQVLVLVLQARVRDYVAVAGGDIRKDLSVGREDKMK